MMDQQTFLEIATIVSKLKMYPYFDVASHILMCLIVRDDNPPQTSGKQSMSSPRLPVVYLSVFAVLENNLNAIFVDLLY